MTQAAARPNTEHSPRTPGVMGGLTWSDRTGRDDTAAGPKPPAWVSACLAGRFTGLEWAAMKSYEVIRQAVDEPGVKAVAAALKVSPALVYKWCEPPADEDDP